MSEAYLDTPDNNPELEEKSPKVYRSIFRSFGNCFKKYIDFKGRSSRYEYWSFTLLNLVFGFVAVLIPIINIIYPLAIIIPSISVWCRRMHDINKSFMKWVVIPHVIIFSVLLVGQEYDASTMQTIGGLNTTILGLMLAAFAYNIVLVVFLFMKGNRKENKYGKPPVD